MAETRNRCAARWVAAGMALAFMLLLSGLFASPRASAAPPAHTDIMFVFDTTGSMEDALYEAEDELQEAMFQIDLKLPDVQYGLSEVRDVGGSIYDEEAPDDLPWSLDVPITANRNAMTTAINGLSAEGGGDYPEAYARALWEASSNPTVGWRGGAKHLIVLVADDVPHDNDLNEGIPPELWIEDSPWYTGEELPWSAGVSGTQIGGSTDLNWQSVLQRLAAEGTPLEFVDFHGDGEYLPYWDNWARRTGGMAVLASTGQLVAELVALAQAGAGDVPAPAPAPAPAPGPPENPCGIVHGSVGKQLLAAAKCEYALKKYSVKCGVEISIGKALKGLETVKGLFVLAKVRKGARPAAKLINDIKKAKFNPRAPRGFRSAPEVIKRIDEADDAQDLVFLLTDIALAVRWEDFKQIALDIGDIAGARACVEGLIFAVES